jgi:hypothetical protein
MATQTAIVKQSGIDSPGTDCEMRPRRRMRMLRTIPATGTGTFMMVSGKTVLGDSTLSQRDME